MGGKDLTNKYSCTGEDGTDYTVYEYTEFVESGTLGNSPQEEAGLKELKLADGSAVNWINESEFQIISTGVKVKVNG
jgi:hypothetical protein